MRLQRLAGTRPQTDIDRRPHHPRQDIEARQSHLRVLFVQAEWVIPIKQELGALWAQTLD
jgi:hypothetical protein